MNVRKLIASMEGVAAPDADVFFLTADGEIHPIEGGLLDTEEGGPRPGLLLAAVECISDGGF